MNPPHPSGAPAAFPDRPAWQRCGFALLMLCLALGGRLLLDPYTTDAIPLATVYTAVAFTVWFGGWRPAAALVVVGYIVGLWWFLPPRHTLKLGPEFGALRTLIYLFSCATTIFLCESLRRAQRRQAASEARALAILDAMHDGFCSFDAAWRLTHVNCSAETQLGLARATACSRSLWELLPHLAGTAAEAELRRAVREKTPVRFETDAFVPGRWTAVNATPSPAGLSLFFHDITARKTHVEDLERQVAERTADLRAMIADLEGFSYTLVHDLRAPLRLISSFASILRSDHAAQLDEDGKQHLRRIEKASRRMDQLVVNVLAYSRLASNKPDIHPVDVDDLVREMLRTYPDFHAEKADITIEGTLPVVRGNIGLLTQCFSNLLHNATKFVARGVKPQIVIRAAINGDTARIEIADNGIGIAPEATERIFEPFQREDPNYEGTGIGLAILKKAVGQLGGRVGVESQPGHGSRFWLEFAVASPDEAEELRRNADVAA